ncbi:MAG: hypothetical protein U1E56_07150 [Bauldia sp.]
MPRFAVLACTLGLAFAAGAPAAATETSAALARSHLEAGTLAAAERELGAVIARDAADQEARFGLGAVRFLTAVEHLSQGFYRYGLKPASSGGLPILRLPVPENPRPQPITYAAFRGILQRLSDDLAAAETALAAMASAEMKVPLDLAAIRYDADGDGRAGDEERLLTVLSRMAGGRPAPALVAFDRGDAYWLQGYCHALMSVADFLLAHDFEATFDNTFHLFFPAADLPLAKALAAPRATYDDFADIVAFIHLVNWPVVDAAKMKGVRLHLKAMVDLSRKSWAAIEAEGDDEREWVPNPRQKDSVTGMSVTADQIAAWKTMLGEVDAVLDGRLLLPHWRLARGFNLRRVFDEPRRFDLVMWVSGTGALPYLEDGPLTTAARWTNITRPFGNGFATYFIWFN